MIVYVFEHTYFIMILLCILLQNTGQPIFKQIHNINSSYLHVICINERVRKFVSLVRNKMKWIYLLIYRFIFIHTFFFLFVVAVLCVCVCVWILVLLLFLLDAVASHLFCFCSPFENIWMIWCCCFGIRNAATASWIGILTHTFT